MRELATKRHGRHEKEGEKIIDSMLTGEVAEIAERLLGASEIPPQRQ